MTPKKSVLTLQPRPLHIRKYHLGRRLARLAFRCIVGSAELYPSHPLSLYLRTSIFCVLFRQNLPNNHPIQPSSQSKRSSKHVMDVQDLSAVPQFVQLRDRQKQLLKMSAAYAGRRPERRDSLSTLVSGFMQSRPQEHRPQQPALRWTFISEVYLPSAVSSRSLTPLSIRDLRLETHHRGKYLLLRTVTPPSKITGILTVVEDERGDGELLQLYNQDERVDPADIIPINTVCLIKEPYYKKTSGGGYAIRVDHVSDLIFPTPLDSRIPLKWRNSQAQTWTAEDWKEHGNAAVRAGNFVKARER
jgi:hypothetical protein